MKKIDPEDSNSSGFFCPLCGCELVAIKYLGNKPDMLAKMKRPDFCGFLGCIRVELHDKIVNGINYRGKAYVIPIFHKK